MSQRKNLVYVGLSFLILTLFSILLGPERKKSVEAQTCVPIAKLECLTVFGQGDSPIDLVCPAGYIPTGGGAYDSSDDFVYFFATDATLAKAAVTAPDRGRCEGNTDLNCVMVCCRVW